MKELTLFQMFERQVEEEAKEWKRKRLEELTAQLGPQAAEVSPPEPKAADQAADHDH